MLEAHQRSHSSLRRASGDFQSDLFVDTVLAPQPEARRQPPECVTYFRRRGSRVAGNYRDPRLDRAAHDGFVAQQQSLRACLFREEDVIDHLVIFSISQSRCRSPRKGRGQRYLCPRRDKLHECAVFARQPSAGKKEESQTKRTRS